jgi:uncharacterized protein YegL
MKNGLSEIIFILDRSGSMEKIRTDMIGGFNSFLKEQKKIPSECKVSLYQFDTNYGSTVEPIYKQMDIKTAPELTLETFVPRGGTPLYDAVATIIKEVEGRLKSTPENEKPEKVLVVCITDGEENSSREWNSKQVKQMIEHQEEQNKWEFVYLGANQDAWNVGENLGFKASSTLGYVATAGGTNSMWKSLSTKTITYRSARCSAGDSISFDEEDKKVQVDQGYKP